MLRKIRVIAAVICFALITCLFLDFTGILHVWFGWLVKIQLIPAILAVNVIILLILTACTLAFGRIYCSVICPLGVLQDGIPNLSGRRKGKKNRFRYSQAISWLRYGILALFVVGLVAGISIIVSLLDPYAAYGRIANNLFASLYGLGNNLLASFEKSIDSYLFYPTEVWIKSGVVLGIAIVALALVSILAWKNGRTYCNMICPVGTMLGFLSRFSFYHPTFDEEKCTKCGLCEKACKASCIDSKNLTIDRSRCVTCFNCIEKCKFNAMNYAPSIIRAEKTDPAIQQPDGERTKGMERAGFLSIIGSLAVVNTVKAQQLQMDGGLADIEDKKVPHRHTPVVPPGAKGAGHMKQHCTACQLCVSACPNEILRPSTKLSTFMQPEMSFERGYCRPECVECSKVCPTSAIQEITTADKTAIAIGQAVWIKDNCVVNTEKLACTACERHCPTKAITLIPVHPETQQEESPAGFPGRRRSPELKYPVIDKELCIGCGACEYLCPARPFSAIYVEGNVRHHTV
ncbi:MAG: 4Fe-4S dicluster domain-containing protein [Tannerellaceae bacterium]|nr:4Fe-4S dicluster domain-containing protein [Tannerellaceae bacterium]